MPRPGPKPLPTGEPKAGCMYDYHRDRVKLTRRGAIGAAIALVMGWCGVARAKSPIQNEATRPTCRQVDPDGGILIPPEYADCLLYHLRNTGELSVMRSTAEKKRRGT